MNGEALLQVLRETKRTAGAVSGLAAQLADISQKDLTPLMQMLIDQGEDKAMGILLNVIAWQRMRVAPEILCKSLKVVDNIDDFTYPFREQDEHAIGPLLDLALAQDISSQRNVLAVIIATQLSIKFGAGDRQVIKTLTKMINDPKSPDMLMHTRATLILMEDEDSRNSFVPRMVERDIHEELPESGNLGHIGQTYTVRRPVPKISRNAPCHCGSGKKYKKCCLDRDQELIHDASPYEGLTMSQVLSSPGLVEDTQVIDNMRAYQLKKVDPRELNNQQLLAAYRKADSFGMHETGYSMLMELKNRPEQEDFAVSHLRDLLHSTLEDGNLELARTIEGQIPEDAFEDESTQKFHMFLLENKDLFMAMENHCQSCLTSEDIWQNNPVDLAYCFEKLFPALAVVFARSAILDQRTSSLDHKYLMQMLRNARTELDLDPFADPIEDYLEWSMEKFDQDTELEAKDREIQDLKQKTAEARRSAILNERDLREKERELQTLNKKLEMEGRLKQVINIEQGQGYVQAKEQADVSHLKRRIERMKMEIREQQNERRRLRQLLEAKQAVKTRADVQAGHGQDEEADATHEKPVQEAGFTPQKVIIPVYTDQFRKNCEQFPAGIVAKALRAVAGFASHDQDILRQSRRLERRPSVYRVRIGLYHRLLLRHEKEDLQVLDLIHRQDLEKWIKQCPKQGA